MSVRRSAGGVWIEKRKKKDMSLILCIETGTDICSVGLARDGELISLRESDQGRDHARQVGVFVDELLSQTGIAPEELDAVAVGKGPGSYTGLRIGVSFTKGLCYGLRIPLVAIGSLDALTEVAKEDYEAGILSVDRWEEACLCPMVDARRMEVYTGYGDKGMTDLSHTKNVSKSDDRICLMGSVEELMSHIGLVRVLVDDVDVVRMLEKISETLKKIIDGVSDPYNREFKVSEDRTELLEEEIGRMKEIFSGERLPILPGDSRVAAEIDVTRAVARRAERELALVSVKFGSDTGAKKYMYRLADYFYVLARYVDAAKIEEKKTDISESVQESVKAETAGIVANVGAEAVGTVGSSADVASGTSAVDVRAQDSQMVQKRDVQAFDVQNGTVTTAVGGNTAMAQNDSIAANTAMIQEVLKRMGIQGRITLDSAKRLIEKIEQEALRRNKPSVIAVCSPDGNPVAVHVMDGSFLVSFEVALKKAYTSVAVKMSTMELSRLTQPGQTFYGLGKMSDNIVIFGGGVPLKVGDTIIGGLGISGGTGEEDNSLAEYGLQVLNEVL